MSFSKLHSAQVSGLQAHIVDIEVDIANGLHSFTVVGLPNKAVEESRDRVSAAIKNCGFVSPKQKNQKVTISLAPADLRKEGPMFDLPIALAYLISSGELFFNPQGKLFFGELSLDGEVRSASGTLALVQKAKAAGFTDIFVPHTNRREAALVDGVRIFGIKKLSDIISHFMSERFANDTYITLQPESRAEIQFERVRGEYGFEDIRGQENAKRGLIVAAAGGHSVALSGPPGTGKTMLAKAFCELLPDLSFEEMLEVTAIHSIAGITNDKLTAQIPFRAPHHTASHSSLIGGGALPKPGEITLAHRGVLFLDEFPEFDRQVIDSLRQPLEEKVVSISRAKGSVRFPADFILIAAMNPCPCGFRGVKNKECVCSPAHLLRYRRKISGPVVDRIDLWIHVETVDHTILESTESQRDQKNIFDSVAMMKQQIATARMLQKKRFDAHGTSYKKSNTTHLANTHISGKELHTFAPLSKEVRELFNVAAEKLGLSARAYHRVWKVARTIADLDASQNIEVKHMLEALHYRPKQ